MDFSPNPYAEFLAQRARWSIDPPSVREIIPPLLDVIDAWCGLQKAEDARDVPRYPAIEGPVREDQPTKEIIQP